ncbi:G protein subunit beta [Malassezia sp. CBS 17886]|nr:G protein subunit beta [Malassezia sp. CBS 17886]
MATVEQDAIATQRIESDLLKQQLITKQTRLADTTLRAAAGGVEKLRAVGLRRHQVMRCPGAKVFALDWAPDSQHVLTASQDRHMLIWNVRSGHKVQAIRMRMCWVTACAYGPGGDLAASGGLDNICTVYNLRMRTDVVGVPVAHELLGHAGYISACRFRSPTEMVTASGDGTCATWDLSRGTLLRQFSGHRSDVLSVATCAKNASIFVSGSADGSAIVWDGRTSRPVCTFDEHYGDVNGVDFFPDGYAFATGTDDGACHLFDLRAHRELASYRAGATPVPITSVSFSLSGRLLVAGSESARVHVWDVLKGDHARTLQAHDTRVACVRVSPDGASLATGGWDSKLAVWGT